MMTENDENTPCQRIDRWLWYARFVKTRALGQRIVSNGKVRVNKTRLSKPSQTVSAGDVVSFMVHNRVRVVKVLATGKRRGPAPEAQLLYEEITPVTSQDGSHSCNA